MKIIKRNGSEVAFDIDKIIIAISKANKTVGENERMTDVYKRQASDAGWMHDHGHQRDVCQGHRRLGRLQQGRDPALYLSLIHIWQSMSQETCHSV